MRYARQWPPVPNRCKTLRLMGDLRAALPRHGSLWLAGRSRGWLRTRWLVVDGRAADLVVGVEESFGQQRADMATAQPIHDPLSVPLALDQASEAQLGQVLAGDRRAAVGEGGEASDVEFGVAQRPQHADACRVGEQRERHNRRADLFGGEVGRMFCRHRLPGAWAARSRRRHGSNCTRVVARYSHQRRSCTFEVGSATSKGLG